MTATNIFYNFVGFRYSPPLKYHQQRFEPEVNHSSMLLKVPEKKMYCMHSCYIIYLNL